MKLTVLLALLATTTQAAATCPHGSEVGGWKTKVTHEEAGLRDVRYSPRGFTAFGMKPLRVDGLQKLVDGKWIASELYIVLDAGDAVPHYPAFMDTFGPLADGKLPDDVCRDGACILHPRGQFAPEKAGDLWMVELRSREAKNIRAWRKAKAPELQLICTYDVQPG